MKECLEHCWPGHSSDRRLLLLSCCAPCSCEIMKNLIDSHFEPTVLYYNPNIDLRTEYEKRKNENKRIAESLNIPFIDADYDHDHEEWQKLVVGLENEPERGKRCSICFQMRLNYAAKVANDKNFFVFSSTLGFSRWKNMEQVNQCGKQAMMQFPNIIYWDYNWRQNSAQLRASQYILEWQIYSQNYCGCSYSRR